jgi:hypothetical protein
MISKLLGESYPKTSCECSECPTETPLWPAIKTNSKSTNNLGLASCHQINQISECHNTSLIGMSKQPNPWKQNSIEVLNPNFGLTKADGFFHTTNDCTVTSVDPRLVNPMHGTTPLQLNRAPYTSEVSLNEIYTDKLDNYGQNYKNYEDINAGQIVYYVDNDIKDCLSLPNFTIRSNVKNTVFKTPMGGLWPTCEATSFTEDHKYISPQQFTRDTVCQREDIMRRLRSKIHRQSFPVGN